MKETMEFELFRVKLFTAAVDKGFKDCEVFYASGAMFSLKVFEGELREYKSAGNAGLSFRGTYRNGKMGYAYTERLGEDIIPFLVDNAAQNAEIIEDTDTEEIFAGSPSYPQVNTWDESLAKLPAADKIAIALKVEQAAKAADPRVKGVDWCGLSSSEGEVRIANSLGLNLYERTNFAGVWSVPRVQGDDGQLKQQGDVWAGKDFAFFDAVAFGRYTAELALSHLGAKSIPTGKYAVILTGTAMSDLLRCFSSVFSAEQAQKGFSLLKGKIGTQVGSAALSIRDDPFLDQMPGSSAFDCEGVATRNKLIIENGVFHSFLHNRKTAKKDGVAPTGNASKRSFKSSVGIGPTNFYIVPSDKTQVALMAELGEGLLIDSLEGLHSGANPVSGDFSVSAEGHEIHEGKKGRAVEQITLAGNFFTLLQDVAAVAADLEFKDRVSSPSVWVRELNVSGL
ncbi:MAG: TldD/PmbA family protein [Treponema sp.]|jgi:PmbA protein|nr:TldD/PmbA family protein [Treponema sp.]